MYVPVTSIKLISQRSRIRPVVQGIDRHLHPLEGLVTFKARDHVFIHDRVTTLLESLDGFGRNQLEWSDIREELLRIPDINMDLIYHTENPLEVVAGDVGIIKDGEFVQLSRADDVTISHHGGQSSISTSCGQTTEDLGDGVLQ